MKWPWTRDKPAEVSELEKRADAAEQIVDRAQAAVDARSHEVSTSAQYFRDRRKRNHLTQLFEELYGGSAT